MDKEDVVLKHNAILVSHKRQCNNGIYSNMDAHRDFILNEVSQKKKDKYNAISLICKI